MVDVTLIRWLRRGRDMHVSPKWLERQRLRDTRVEFHGVCWKWPVSKAHSRVRVWTMARLLKRRAA